MLSIYLPFPLDIYISGLWSVVSKGFAVIDVLLYSILLVECSCSYKRIEMKRLGYKFFLYQEKKDIFKSREDIGF